jgi:DNA invertase Pin-like site-specific DNA recombinase
MVWIEGRVMTEAKRWVAYYRVSTAKQGASGLGLEAQEAAVVQHVASAGGRIVAQFRETESGKNNDRPELLKAMAAARLHRATLIIAKLDRLSRDAHFLLGLQKAGVPFVCADMPDANDMTVGIMAIIAQHERKIISERTKAALAAAKKRGTVLGGKREGSFDLRKAAAAGNAASAVKRSKAARDRAVDLGTVIAELRQAGSTSLGQIAAGLNERGILTAQGKEWRPMQVSRVLETLKRSEAGA